MKRLSWMLLLGLFAVTPGPKAWALQAAIPYKPDPPFAIDGALQDWSHVPKAAAAEAPIVDLAWRHESLFIAVRLPLKETELTCTIAAIRLLFSLQEGAVPTVSLGEAGQLIPGSRIARQETGAGHVLEAAIPWKALGVADPKSGLLLQVAVDGERDSAAQTCVLAEADGTVPPPPDKALFDERSMANGASDTVKFMASDYPGGERLTLHLKARLHTDQVAGHTAALRVFINETPLDQKYLLNKPLRATSRGGAVYSLSAGTRFTTFYSPDYESAKDDPHYGLVEDIDPCAFVFDLTTLVQEGENVIRFEHGAAGSVDNTLHIGGAVLRYQAAESGAAASAGPPAGPLPWIEPRRAPADFSHEQGGDSTLEITVGEGRYVIQSQFSTPDGVWATGSNAFFEHTRKVSRDGGALLVEDTFTNRTGDDLPLMHRHGIIRGAGETRCWLGGLEQPSGAGSRSEPANPTVYLARENNGIGLATRDDVMRVHITSYAEHAVAGLADRNLVLTPGATYTASWMVIPTETPDYWEFINVARRHFNANFIIDGGFTFFRADAHTDVWSDEETAAFLAYKDVRYACASITYPLYDGEYPHGTAFQRITHGNFSAAFERRRKLQPGIQNLVYFHSFIDVTEDGPERYADARVLLADGTQADYGEAVHKIFLPTENNAYGPAVAKNVDIILDEIGAEGVYWDEHQYSRWQYHFGPPWDGVTGDIDPDAMTLRGKKSSVVLLTDSWRLALAKRILARGPLIGNGPPLTQGVAALQFPCFVETGSITHCVQAHLHSPIALGDHLTEHKEEDAYYTMLAALDYGCLYHWYNDLTVIPTHHHLTRYMFPFTPIEIHGGYVIGEERIITRVSGNFGWGDASVPDVHVFDQLGNETGHFEAPLVEREGSNYIELRLAEGWSAAIVRKEPG